MPHDLCSILPSPVLVSLSFENAEMVTQIPFVFFVDLSIIQILYSLPREQRTLLVPFNILIFVPKQSMVEWSVSATESVHVGTT